jgi:hypothetical protein
MLMKNFAKTKGFFSFNKISKKFKFLQTTKPWSFDQNVDELPKQGEQPDFRMSSKRTFTKWFNPMTFDPRTPDYFETVRSDWHEDVTREDFGEGNF